MSKEKKKGSISAYSILFIILIVLGILTLFLDGQSFSPQEVDGETISQVKGAQISDIIMAPFNGFKDAIEIAVFVLILGGFLNIVAKTGALESGVQTVVNKLKGKEIMIIPILMILFSLGGSTYGMAEETIPFYSLLAVTMVVAGFDTVVAVGTVLLGAGAGVLGSTVNPFSTGVAMDALRSVEVEPNTGIIILVGAILWAVATAFSIFIVMRYAKKVQKNKSLTILSSQEQEDMEEKFNQTEAKYGALTKRQKIILSVFAFAFVVMIVSLIPWGDFGITIFNNWTSFLTGESFGNWYFGDLAMWFFIIGLICAMIGGFSEKETVNAFVDGAKDMLSVVLIIVVARGVSALMANTHLDLFVLDRASDVLQGLSPILFVVGSYILYLGLSFIIPSTSGLAYVSIPIMGPLAYNIGLSPEVMIMIFASGCGLINLITPTSGVVMGGLEIAKVEYSTWLKFMAKPIFALAALNLIILVISMLVLS